MKYMIAFLLLLPFTAYGAEVTNPDGAEILQVRGANESINLDNITKQSTTGSFATDSITGILDADSGTIYNVDVTDSNVTVNGSIGADSFNLQQTVDGGQFTIFKEDSAGSNYFGIGSSPSRTTDLMFIYPDTAPTEGQIMEWSVPSTITFSDGTPRSTTTGSFKDDTIGGCLETLVQPTILTLADDECLNYLTDGKKYTRHGDNLYVTAQVVTSYNTLTVTPPVESYGTITCSDSDLVTAINCDDGATNTDCSSLVSSTAEVTGLTLVENGGTFEAWNGAITTTNNPSTTPLIVNTDKTVGVDFVSGEVVETFNTSGSPDLTWTLTDATLDKTPALEGAYSLGLDDPGVNSYAGTSDFAITNTLVVSWMWQYTADPASDNVIMRFIDTGGATLSLLRMGSTEKINAINGSAYSVIGNFGPTTNGGYYDINHTYYTKVKIVQNVTAGTDEYYVWVSEDGVAWSSRVARTDLTFGSDLQLETVRFDNVIHTTAYTYDHIKITTDGSDTSDY